MAPERTGQNRIPETQVVLKQEDFADHPVKKTNSILEDFLEIKIKEELDYQGVRRRRREEDQDLTSLHWLQSNNLLKSKPLKLSDSTTRASARFGASSQLKESPTSDLTEESLSECSSTNHSQAGFVQTHTLTSPTQTTQTVVHYGAASDPLMDGGPSSVSFEEEAHTEEDDQQQGYTRLYVGNKEKQLYSVPYDPQLHVNSKPPYSFSCLIFMAIEDSHARALPVKEIYSWITDHFPYFNKAPTGWKNSVRHNLSLNKCFRKVDKAPNLGKGSLWIVDPQYRPNLLNALAKAPYHPCASLDRQAKSPVLHPVPLAPQQTDMIQVKTQSRLPNPELFPYLSKRLAASEVDRMEETDEGSDGDSLDDVDAAAAMLELKHGQPRPKIWRKKARMEAELLISTSPSEDHTYTSFNSGGSNIKVLLNKTETSGGGSLRQSGGARAINHSAPPLSPDEAYGGETDDDLDEKSPFVDETEESWSSDGAEQRNVASALLNLAGGTRKRGHHGTPSILSRSTRGRRSARGQRGSRRGGLRGRRSVEPLNNNSEKLSSGRSKQSQQTNYR